MGIRTKEFDISVSTTGIAEFFQSDALDTILYTQIIISGADADVTFDWFQGNTNVSADMTPILNDKDNPITITEPDGEYLTVMNTFFGKYGEVRFTTVATVGLIKITYQTHGQ